MTVHESQGMQTVKIPTCSTNQLESVEMTSTNLSPCASSSDGDEYDDAGGVEADWEEKRSSYMRTFSASI
jgi:hypothetical protein